MSPARKVPAGKTAKASSQPAAGKPSRAAGKKSAGPKGQPVLLIGTRKGAFILHGDAARKDWKLSGPHFLGSQVHHLVLDPRDERTLLMAARTGHLGPTVFRSKDWGRTWKEAARPPAFAKVPEGEKGRSVHHVFWLTPGHASQPGVWFAGTSPQALFRSDDGGETWTRLATPYKGSLYGLIGVPTPKGEAVVLYGFKGRILRSEDAGATWEEIASPAKASLYGAALLDDGTVVLAGAGGTLLASKDAGRTFAPAGGAAARGLNIGVVDAGGGQIVVTGAGGARAVELAPRSGAKP